MSTASGIVPRDPTWSQLKDEELLQLPLKSLKLRIKQSPLAPRLEQLQAELDRAGLRLTPRVWFSLDWFSPDGVAGIAVPFFLGHARLIRLERRQMTWAEGASIPACMGLLRHEAGHAIDTAFGLSRTKLYRTTFGRRSETYRRHYSVDPRSNGFVHHLDRWYAQSHPSEDFAECFAVWLASRGRRTKRYAGTPAGNKLIVLAQLMDSVRGQRPDPTEHEEVEAVERLSSTLEEHYAARRKRLKREWKTPFHEMLVSRFAPGRPWNQRAPAALLLARHRKQLVERAGQGSQLGIYAANQVVGLMIQHARELGLGLAPRAKSFELDPWVRMIRVTLQALGSGEYLLSR